jgi:hypothetical protein
MLELLKKYLNGIILFGTAISMIVGAIVWVPQTLLTKAEAEQHFNSHLDRDKDLERKIIWNYLEIQISLNELILKDYEMRMDSLSHDEKRRYEAIKAGQTRLHERRERLNLEGVGP